MFDLLLIYIGFYSVFIIWIIFIGYFAQRRKEKRYRTGSSTIHPTDITVLIPFRNEEGRLQPLLKSINQLKLNPSKYLFVDDHSTDKGVELIKESLKDSNYSILHVPEGQEGKKEAIRFATKHVETKYILTIDADVILSGEYFSELAALTEGDMYVLPVIMEPKSVIQHLYEIDLVLVTAANTGLAGLTRPIMASGANFLYNKRVFDKVDNYASHAHAASGDDTYLLRDFRLNNADVRLHTSPAIAIRTETPQSFKEFIGQRLRWIGKTKDIKDNLSTTLAVSQAILTIIFFGFLVSFAVIKMWWLLLILFGLKSGIDMIVFAPYFFRLKRYVSWLLLPLYELLFPIYTIIIAILLLTYKPKWKGREIYANS